ncbi:MAG: polysaccharide biosynthesis protein GtrA [Caldibacillus debilis]|jgi:putative flippase GtrA|uniref:Putative membrane protein n=1 Tax=Caldibacillus debilis GB1 TaxID=1339248 RepID=A0A420VJ33_9BACI|nr:GtrA family protein [Caldibacillus debilis]MBO2482778.1 polysaccharide biosynthesis protein GtrA [Bacillaceae bacterium]REJ16234.1 MAG: polysaccharide biosynthesis protein GtrA [Caldibacillus debilis]REJ25880.1 MAG: polysaccharide biosynthesis protein GtrA [Caldibacillus debilis]RKO63681.1 putative membrane protein [Caldibacillus debilis GB1]
MKIQSPFIKFLGVGVINTCIGLSVTFLCLTLFGLPYWPSTFIGNGAGALASFFLNRRFTFRSDVRVGSGLFRFILVIFLCYLLSYKAGLALAEGALRHLEPVERYTEEWAVLFGNGLYTVTNYFGQKWFVFRKTKTKREWGGEYGKKILQ